MNRFRWSDAGHGELVRGMLAQGLTDDAIAERLGRSRKAVGEYRRRALGMPCVRASPTRRHPSAGRSPRRPAPAPPPPGPDRDHAFADDVRRVLRAERRILAARGGAA